MISSRSKGKQVACTKPREQTVVGGGQARQRVPRSWQTFIPCRDARERSCVKGLRLASYRCLYRHRLFDTLSPSLLPPEEKMRSRLSNTTEIYKEPSQAKPPPVWEAEVNKRERETALSPFNRKGFARPSVRSEIEIRFVGCLPRLSSLFRGKGRGNYLALFGLTGQPAKFLTSVRACCAG